MKKYYILLIGMFSILIGKLLYISIIKYDYYVELLAQKTIITLNGGSAPRGRILDINGNVLVDNKGINNLYYNKIKGITKTEEVNIAKKLAKLLTIKEGNTNELKEYWLVLNNNGKELITDEEYMLYEQRKITNNDINKMKIDRITDEHLNSFDEVERKEAHIYHLMNEGYNYQKKLIVKNIEQEQSAKIIEEGISGITLEVAWERVYPYNEVFKELLGTVGAIPKEEKSNYLSEGYELTDIVGLSFLEKEYEEYLKGNKAVYIVNKDNTLSMIKEAEKGNDLILSIDVNIQIELEKILKEKIANGKKFANTEYYKDSYAVVGNPNNGEILAISGIRLNDDKTFSDISANMLTSSFTIGSTVKAGTISVGYKYGLIEPDKYITDSCIKLYSIPQKCSHKRLGRINDISALAQSSNYYQFLIAIALTGNKYQNNMKLNASEQHFKIYRDMLKSYGLGAISGIDLPNEKTGIEGSKIADDLLLNLAIGQYDTYTILEVLQYINSVATSNRLKLNLVHQIKNKDKIIFEYNPMVLNKVNLDDEYLFRIREGLNKVLLEGTGRGFVDKTLNPVGKTGTSETFYDSHKTNSSTFAGYFPKDNPKYSLVVITPNVFNKEGNNKNKYYAARLITRQMTDFLANY